MKGSDHGLERRTRVLGGRTWLARGARALLGLLGLGENGRGEGDPHGQPEAPQPPVPTPEVALAWYERAEGRRRLAAEMWEWDRLGMAPETFLAAGRLGFCLDRGGGRELLAVCPEGYPQEPPVVICRRLDRAGNPEEWVAPLPVRWHQGMSLVQVVTPLLGPDRAAATRERYQE